MAKPDTSKFITADMTVLDIISRYRKTEAVFKQYDQPAGECICCQALFEPIATVAKKYNLNLCEMLENLEQAISSETSV